MTNENPLALSFQLTRTSTSFFTSQQHHLPSCSLHVLPVSSLVKPPSLEVCMMHRSSCLPWDSYRHLFEARMGSYRNQASAGRDRWFAGRSTSWNVSARTPFLTTSTTRSNKLRLKAFLRIIDGQSSTRSLYIPYVHTHGNSFGWNQIAHGKVYSQDIILNDTSSCTYLCSVVTRIHDW